MKRRGFGLKSRELGLSSCERSDDRVRVEGVAVEAIVERERPQCVEGIVIVVNNQYICISIWCMLIMR